MLKSFVDGRIFGERVGDGPVQVTALHGWGRDRRDLLPVVDGYDAVAFDLPGFGASPPPDEPIGSAGYADLVAEALREIDAGPVVVLGHSFGGRVGMALAQRHPELVAGLVLTGTPLVRRDQRRGRPAPSYRLVRFLYRRGIIPERWFETVRRIYGSPDYLASSGLMRDILVRVVNESYEDAIAGLHVPLELVWGATDKEVPVPVADQAVAIARRAGVPVRLTVVSGAGHLLPFQAPDALRAAIERVLPDAS